jgi:phosphoribosylformylglycinamidine synthase
MTDLIEGRKDLENFDALVACGGFSYGDVLGAGSGWAKSILYNPLLKDQFASFFANKDTLALGVCNGCQMLSQLKSIIPGAEDWPYFSRNKSEQFEARFANVAVLKSPSLFFKGMEGSVLPIPVAHGEGRTNFSQTGNLQACSEKNIIGMRYVDSKGNPSEAYPINPNGSINGDTSFTTSEGRVTIMMPHPERCFRSVQMSYGSSYFKGEKGPWMKLFENARSAF